MIKGTSAELAQLAREYVCSEHGSPVVVAWHKDENSLVLRCGEGHYPEEVTRQHTLTSLWRQGKLADGPIKDNIERRERQKLNMQPSSQVAKTQGGVPTVDLATGEQLTGEQIYSLTQFALRYKLDVFRGHVVVMYGKPYIGLDGYLYHANQAGNSYTLDARPMTTEELTQYKIGDTDHGWLAWVRFPDKGTSFTGIGIVTYEEMTAKSPRDNTRLRSPVVAAHPWQLAQKRAEWQALRRAFPIGDTEEVKEGDADDN